MRTDYLNIGDITQPHGVRQNHSELRGNIKEIHRLHNAMWSSRCLPKTVSSLFWLNCSYFTKNSVNRSNKIFCTLTGFQKFNYFQNLYFTDGINISLNVIQITIRYTHHDRYIWLRLNLIFILTYKFWTEYKLTHCFIKAQKNV